MSRKSSRNTIIKLSFALALLFALSLGSVSAKVIDSPYSVPDSPEVVPDAPDVVPDSPEAVLQSLYTGDYLVQLVR